jgi:hypothetical protein
LAHLNIVLAGPSRFLLECVEHENRVCEFRDIEYPILVAGMNPNLNDSGPDSWHGTIVVRILAQLDEVQLMSSLTPSVLGEIANVVE